MNLRPLGPEPSALNQAELHPGITRSPPGAGERGIVGVMLESFLVEGRQDLNDASRLTYGQSITDACISWETTECTLDELATAVRARRVRAGPRSLVVPLSCAQPDLHRGRAGQ